MEEARPRHLSAALTAALLAGTAAAGGPASRVDAAARFAVLGPLVEGASPERRASAAPSLDRAVDALFRGDWPGAIAASGEARDLLLGRRPTLAGAIAWGTRVAAVPPLLDPDPGAERRVELRLLSFVPPGPPDFVETRLRLEPFDAGPIPLIRTSSRRSDLVGRGDFLALRFPELEGRAALVATMRAGDAEAETVEAWVAFASGAAARLEKLRSRKCEAPPSEALRDVAATLEAELSAFEVAARGELPFEDFDPGASLERCEALAAALEEGKDPFPAERGESRRATVPENGGPVPFRLWIPTAPPPPEGHPLLLLVPSAFETEAAPFRAWAGGALRDLAEARGVLVAAFSPTASPVRPLSAVLRSVRRSHPVDPRRIHLLGRGSGATDVQREGLSHAAELASLAMFDGGLATEKLVRPFAQTLLVAGGAGRGPTAPASRAIAEVVEEFGPPGRIVRVIEGQGWFESSMAIVREAVERAASVRRGEPR